MLPASGTKGFVIRDDSNWEAPEFGRSRTIMFHDWKSQQKSDEPSQKKDFIKNYETPELQMLAPHQQPPSPQDLPPLHWRALARTHTDAQRGFVYFVGSLLWGHQNNIDKCLQWFAMMCFLLPSFVEVVLQWCFYIMLLVASFLSCWYLVDCWGFCNATSKLAREKP